MVWNEKDFLFCGKKVLGLCRYVASFIEYFSSIRLGFYFSICCPKALLVISFEYGTFDGVLVISSE